MKRAILFLFGLSLMAVSCSDDDDNNPKGTPNPDYKAVTLDEIVKDFKFIDGVGAKDVSKAAMADFEAWVKELNEVTKYNDVAKEGKAGKLGKRYINAKGVETIQLIKKGLIGALQLNNFNNALMSGIQGKDAAARKKAVDMGVKYLLGSDKPKTKDEFKAEGNAFGKYMMSVAASTKYKDIDKHIYKAIEMAYANVDNKEKYGEYLLDLNKHVVTVVAFRGVHYLAGYGGKIREKDGFTGENVHELSEGLGFAYSLQFAYKPRGQFYLSPEEAKKFANVNLWEEAKDKSGNSFLDKESERIAEMFGFTVADAK